MSCGALSSFRFSFGLFPELFPVDKKVYRKRKIIRKSSKHFKVGAALSVFIIGEGLAADAQIHSDLELAETAFFSRFLQAYHTVQREPRPFKNAVDYIVTKCYYNYVTVCYIYLFAEVFQYG